MDYSYSYSYEPTPQVDFGSVFAGGVGIVMTLFWIGFLLLTIVANWKMFQKAGYPGFYSIIPFFNTFVLFKLAWGSGWKMLWMFVPIANFVVAIMHPFKISKAFGHGFLFGLGLFWLGPVFMLILGFGSSQYCGPNGVYNYDYTASTDRNYNNYNNQQYNNGQYNNQYGNDQYNNQNNNNYYQ